jgi:hypothetical protein
MGTLRWEKEQEDRRTRERNQRAAEVREAQAEQALVETRNRVEALARELALREAEFERARAERVAEVETSASAALTLRRLRDSNTQSPPAVKKSRESRKERR